ncbi:MAG TPA: energy transducer TonB [Rhizomicrobium sp.]|jgi:protein TonB
MSVIIVGALHVLLIWALATGLASQFFKKPPDVLNTEVIKEKPPEQNKVPPPPPPEMVKPPPPFVPPPDIDVQVASTNTNSITTTTTKPVAPPPPAPPAATQLKAIGRTHTIPPYPLLAQRLSQQGTVTLRVTINTEGDVTDAVIQTSSGVDTLDQAAIEWVKAHWRWEPPTQNGQPSAASTLVAIKFNLKDAH